MKFIQDNSLIHKLSKTSRRLLLWDAEKMACAMSLWSAQNARMGVEENSALAEAVEGIELPRVTEEDTIRSFFRGQVRSILQSTSWQYRPETCSIGGSPRLCT